METVMLQSQWGWQIATYLFLGGLGGGSLVVAAFVNLRHGDGMHATVRFAAWAGVACLAVGTLLLLADVSMPLRALMMWQSFTNPASWMTIGAWLLFCGIAVSVIYALMNVDPVMKRFGGLAKARRAFAVLLVVLGLCIAAYTGILLCAATAHPLWNTPLLPCLFVTSALDTGVALLLLFATLRENPADATVARVTGLLEKATCVLVTCEAVVVVALLATVASGSEAGAASVGILVGGQLAVQFWVLFVVVGLAVPAACAAVTLRAHRKTAPKTAAGVPAQAADDAQAQVGGETGMQDAAVQAADGVAGAPEEAGKTAAGAGKARPVVGALCCLVGGCALRFLVLAAGIPVWAL